MFLALSAATGEEPSPQQIEEWKAWLLLGLETPPPENSDSEMEFELRDGNCTIVLSENPIPLQLNPNLKPSLEDNAVKKGSRRSLQLPGDQDEEEDGAEESLGADILRKSESGKKTDSRKKKKGKKDRKLEKDLATESELQEPNAQDDNDGKGKHKKTPKSVKSQETLPPGVESSTKSVGKKGGRQKKQKL